MHVPQFCCQAHDLWASIVIPMLQLCFWVVSLCWKISSSSASDTPSFADLSWKPSNIHESLTQWCCTIMLLWYKQTFPSQWQYQWHITVICYLHIVKKEALTHLKNNLKNWEKKNIRKTKSFNGLTFWPHKRFEGVEGPMNKTGCTMVLGL